jgi:DNA-binding response OmpR family regulator
MGNAQKVEAGGSGRIREKPLILIVDDVPKNIQVVGNILREKDYEIAFSQNGRDALAKVISNPVDLVLLDIMMPEMDGYQVCLEMRKDPETMGIPVIFLTAKTDTEDMVKGFEVGGQDYLTKPFNHAELLARVHTHMELKKNRDTILQINAQLKQEITERKKTEEELKSHRDHIKLINRILRHDIINDLFVIDTELQLYDTLNDDELLKKAAVRVNKSVELINKMRELETFTSSYHGLKRYSITEVLEEVIASYPTIAFSIEGGGRVLADESLNSVMDNIINNAVVHGKTDRIDIGIRVKGEFREVRIADHGTGIPDEIKESIFEENFVHGETGNTGLGLYIVRKAMENYGGSVHVEDNVPGGAVFVLALRAVGEYTTPQESF